MMSELIIVILGVLIVAILVFGAAAWHIERARQSLEALRRRNRDESSDSWSSVERVQQTLKSSRPKKRRRDG